MWYEKSNELQTEFGERGGSKKREKKPRMQEEVEEGESVKRQGRAKRH